MSDESGRDQAKVLALGASLLASVLEPAGFEFLPSGHGKGSGGPASWGRFVREDQYIELHFRYSLGLVSYGWGDVVLSHRDYLRGIGATGAYPGFSEDPLDGFRHLSEDLAGPLTGFVSGDRMSFDRAIAAAAEPERRLLT